MRRCVDSGAFAYFQLGYSPAVHTYQTQPMVERQADVDCHEL
jgi:hypothetical protein